MRLDPLAGHPQLTVPRPSAKQPSKTLISTRIDRFLGTCVYLLMDECVGVVREFSKEEIVRALVAGSFPRVTRGTTV